MKRRWIYLIFGFLFVLVVTAHFFRGATDALTLKAGNGELVLYVIPGSFGAEYCPESYLDYIVKYQNWGYGGMPFIGQRTGVDMTETSYPKRITGHPYFYSFNGPWPHKAIAVGIPAWILLILFLVGIFTVKLAAEQGSDGKPDNAAS